MTGVSGAAPASLPALRRLLWAPRYEVIPVTGIEERLSGLEAGTTVTVTASPSLGLERTIEVSLRLVQAGYRAVPHLAARMVGSREELAGIVDRLAAAGIEELFVVGGDASPPAGPYSSALELLEALAGLPYSFARIGVAGYPEGHPLVSGEHLLEALVRKQPYAQHVVTNFCFDAAALVRWEQGLRTAGVELPIVVGMPGVVARRKLAEIALQTGVGASIRYLTRHGRQVAALARSRRYDPTPLARAVAGHLDEPGSRIEGVHLFTFNQVDATREWVRRTAGR